MLLFVDTKYKLLILFVFRLLNGWKNTSRIAKKELHHFCVLLKKTIHKSLKMKLKILYSLGELRCWICQANYFYYSSRVPALPSSFRKKHLNSLLLKFVRNSEVPIACEQALLFGQAKRASRERAREGPRKGEVQMKFYERSLQALLS